MSDLIHEVRLAMAKIRQDTAEFSDSQLRDLLCTADILTYMVRKELAARDARMVDEACALQGRD